MNAKPEFHGSDLKGISQYYGIPKESIINFGANVNPLGLSKKVQEQLRRNLDIICTYPERDYASLKNTIGKYCHASPDYIAVGNGSTELISLLIRIKQPKKTLILGPTYSEYARELSFSGSDQEYFYLKAENGFKPDMDGFLDELGKGYDFLILCNPNNPTSSAIKLNDMRRILKTCQEKQIFVMVDETYVEFAEDISQVTAVPLACEFHNFMVIRGISKFFAAPGLRLGYAITRDLFLLEQLKELQIPWSLNSIGAFAGELLLSDSEYIQKTRSLILGERARLFEKLSLMKNITVYDAQANFILLQIHKENVGSIDVFEACIRKGMMIRDCTSFASLHGAYIRFCIMKPQDNTRLIQTLEKVLQ